MSLLNKTKAFEYISNNLQSTCRIKTNPHFSEFKYVKLILKYNFIRS